MGMTMIERILARKAGVPEVHAGDTVTVEPPCGVLFLASPLPAPGG